jgi:hypothetical protein
MLVKTLEAYGTFFSGEMREKKKGKGKKRKGKKEKNIGKMDYLTF